MSRRLLGKPRLVHPENIAGGQDHRPLNDVLQFPDIARPVIGLKQFERVLVNRPDILACNPGVTLNEMLSASFPSVPQLFFSPCGEKRYANPLGFVKFEPLSWDFRCMVERSFSLSGNVAIVPWGAELSLIEDAIRALLDLDPPAP